MIDLQDFFLHGVGVDLDAIKFISACFFCFFFSNMLVDNRSLQSFPKLFTVPPASSKWQGSTRLCVRACGWLALMQSDREQGRKVGS